MRRFLVYTVVSLVLGVFTTIVIAWGIELYADPLRCRMASAMGHQSEWLSPVPDDWPAQPRCVSNVEAMGVPSGARIRIRQGMFSGIMVSTSGGTSFPEDDPKHVIEFVEVGWPAPTMRRIGADDARPPTLGYFESFRRGFPIRSLVYPNGGGDVALPLTPKWPAFAVSILGWASAYFAVYMALVAPRTIKRRRRCMRGQCTRCGYDLDGLETCPECGSAA
jgi:hypothetical protein